MFLRPLVPVLIMASLPGQKPIQSMLPPCEIFTHLLSCTRQIPQCLLFLVGNIDYRQLSRPVQPGQIPRVPPVRGVEKILCLLLKKDLSWVLGFVS